MDDYAYINARIRGLRSVLLGKRHYDEILARPDLKGLRDYLSGTIYGRWMEEGSAPGRSDRMQEALRDAWASGIRRVYQMTDGEPRQHIEVLLGWWEVDNLKAILRGRYGDVGLSETLAAVLPSGVFDEAALAELARQPSIQACADLLSTWRSVYAKPLKKVLRSERELKGTEALELALDRYYFAEAHRRIEGRDEDVGSIRKFIGLLADRANLLTAYKVSREGRMPAPDLASHFIEGGYRFSISSFQAAARAPDLAEFIHEIGKTFYAEVAQGLGTAPERIPASVRLEMALDRFILGRVEAWSATDVLGVGLMLGYLLKKFFEIRNIRILIKAKDYGIYPEDARALILMR